MGEMLQVWRMGSSQKMPDAPHKKCVDDNASGKARCFAGCHGGFCCSRDGLLRRGLEEGTARPNGRVLLLRLSSCGKKGGCRMRNQNALSEFWCQKDGHKVLLFVS